MEVSLWHLREKPATQSNAKVVSRSRVYIRALCISFHQTQVKDPIVCRLTLGWEMTPSFPQRRYRQICHNLTSWHDSKVCWEALG